MEVAAPVSRIWLNLVHAIKVKKRDHIVFGIAGHIDDLREKKRLLSEGHDGLHNMDYINNRVMLSGYHKNLCSSYKTVIYTYIDVDYSSI